MTFLGSFRRQLAVARILESIVLINIEIEQGVSSQLMTEKMIEALWSRARDQEDDAAEYWLLLMRLAEAALLCAGRYADNCEFEAAGDLLVNPREIIVHHRADGHAVVKNRHGRLSEQFGLDGARLDTLKRLSEVGCPEITKPPLLPHMTDVLNRSGRVCPAYLERLAHGGHRVAETLAFLAAWRIYDVAHLYRRLRAVPVRDREFAESHLCRFDARTFHQIGASLERCLTEADYRSPFLAGIQGAGSGFERRSPAGASSCAAATG